MPFNIIRNDITKVRADAIVNTANPKPVIGRGTDSAIYAAAGREQLLSARKEIGAIEPGQAVSTEAFDLKAKYIIHTVGPVWIDGSHGEQDILHSCYANSLALAADLKCKSIAFPVIASGVYGFPKDEALNIALAEIGKFLLTHEMKVTMVVFDRMAVELSKELVGGIEEYIDENAAQELRAAEYGASYTNRRRNRLVALKFLEDSAIVETEESVDEDTAASFDSFLPDSPFPDMSGKTLDEAVRSAGKSFQERLFELIDASGMDDVMVYKKANIDRKVFSSIRCKPDYRPKKKTAVAFAIALQLDMPTMQDLLARAGIAFSPNDTFDLIIGYFVTHGIYDIYEINAALFHYGQPILG